MYAKTIQVLEEENNINVTYYVEITEEDRIGL